jgi:nucleoside-diphosphate-sugar epimerase
MRASSATPSLKEFAGRRLLIIGGSGFVGSRLGIALDALGAQVASFSRTRGMLDETGAARTVRLLTGDILDAQQTLAAFLEFRPHVVVHLAAHPDAAETLSQAQESVRVGGIGTVNVLEAFRRSGGDLLVYGDSSKVYGNCPVPYRESLRPNPTSSYAIGKATGWEMCTLYRNLYGVHSISVRPTLIYGPGQRFNLFSYLVESVLKGAAEIKLDGGQQTRDPLFIDDAVAAYIATIRAGSRISGRVINIGGGAEIGVEALARLVVRMMGGNQSVVAVAGRARPTEIWRSYCDNVEARALIGWSPAFDLARGLEITIRDLVQRSRPRLQPRPGAS